MMNRAKYLFSLLILFLSTSAVSAQGGRTGLSFLKLGVGGRALGMGEAYSAIASDAAAAYFNPSGLVENQRVEIMIMHKELFQGARSEFLGISVPFEQLSLGFSIISTNVDDIEIRTRPGPPEGTFSTHDVALGISFGYKISSELNIGATGKILLEKILIDESTGFALDLGILYKSPIRGLRFALVGDNFGSMSTLRSESTRLPALVRVGTSFTNPIGSFDGNLLLSADIVKVLHEDRAHLNTGAELNFHQTISARVGYQLGYEEKGVTTGFGVQYGLFKLDYGFIPVSMELNNMHTVSVSVNF